MAQPAHIRNDFPPSWGVPVAYEENKVAVQMLNPPPPNIHPSQLSLNANAFLAKYYNSLSHDLPLERPK